MQLQEIITRRAELQKARENRVAEHVAFIKATESELAALADAEALIVGGLDYAKLERGRQIVAVTGLVSKVCRGRYPENTGNCRSEVLSEAKADIATGAARLARGYLGVKNYDAFGDQRTDCEYGMGPRHGSIVFSIGLTREARDQLRSGQPLLAEQIDAALYLLSALPKIEELRAERVAA